MIKRIKEFKIQSHTGPIMNSMNAEDGRKRFIWRRYHQTVCITH